MPEMTGTAMVVNVPSDVAVSATAFVDSARKKYGVPGVRPVSVWLCDVSGVELSGVIVP